jgi:hypothetical protein
VEQSIESRRAATRFEPDAVGPIETNVLEGAEAKSTVQVPPTTQPTKPATEGEDPDSYTSRLLKAKKQVWQDRPQDKPDTED